jgi:rubredoxin
MKKMTIRGWTKDVPCGGSTVRVYFVLPDTFFDVTLFTCRTCGALVGVDREREHYSGRPFERLRDGLACPQCGTSFTELTEYPETFVGLNGEEGHFVPAPTYPPDSEFVEFEVWDPYAA